MRRRELLLKVILAPTVFASFAFGEPLPPPQAAPPPAQTQPAAARPAATQVPALVAPPRRGFTLADLKAQVPQNEKGQFQMEVPAILNTATDSEVQQLLAGQAIETTGQVMLETTDKADGRHLRIYRAQMLCCSTHARQCSVAIELPESVPAFKELAWVKLVGTLTYRREDKRIVPVVVVSEISETPAPKNQLLQ